MPHARGKTVTLLPCRAGWRAVEPKARPFGRTCASLGTRGESWPPWRSPWHRQGVTPRCRRPLSPPQPEEIHDRPEPPPRKLVSPHQLDTVRRRIRPAAAFRPAHLGALVHL